MSRGSRFILAKALQKRNLNSVVWIVGQGVHLRVDERGWLWVGTAKAQKTELKMTGKAEGSRGRRINNFACSPQLLLSAAI